MRAPGFFSAHGIDLHLANRAVAIDRARRRVTLADGEVLAYDQLVLATGARVRKLSCEGAQLPGIAYLRSLADARTLSRLLKAAQHVSIVGGGFIGLEFAAVAAQMGKSVTVIEALDRLMGRAVGPIMSAYFLDLHQRHHVDVRLGAQLAGFGGHSGKLRELRLGDGTQVPADLAVVGIGVLPNAEIALAAGLACDNGIAVDAGLRTSDPDVFAIGDCARFPTPFSSQPVRLESVQNAIDQGKHVAAAILGTVAPYQALPWFWTEQFDARLQMAGLNQGFDTERLRGDIGSGSFSVDYFWCGRLIGTDSVNQGRDHMLARRALAVTP